MYWDVIVIDCNERRLQTRLSDERKEKVNYRGRVPMGDKRVKRINDDEDSCLRSETVTKWIDD